MDRVVACAGPDSAAMAHYKTIDTSPRFLAVDLEAQLLPGPSSMRCITCSSTTSTCRPSMRALAMCLLATMRDDFSTTSLGETGGDTVTCPQIMEPKYGEENKMRFVIAMTALCLLVGAKAGAQDTVDQVAALDKKCEAARQAKLMPIRARKIEQCVREGNRSRASCEIFYSTYGNSSRVVRGRFYDLPQCVTARKALDRMNNSQNF